MPGYTFDNYPSAQLLKTNFGMGTRSPNGEFNYSTISPNQNSNMLGDDIWSKWLGGKDNVGYLNTGLNIGNSIFNAYAGLKQLGMAQDSFDHQKKLAAVNLANQAQSYNTQLEDRRRDTLRASGKFGDSPELAAYLEANKVKGTL